MIRKPWGSEQIIFEAGDARVKLLRVKPGKRLSEQYHREKREAMMLLNGEAILDIGCVPRHMIVGQIFQIVPGAVHRIESVGQSDAMILEMAHGSDADIVGSRTTTGGPRNE